MTETARAYASALYGLAREEGAEEELLSQLRTASRLLEENPDYETLLSTPSILKEDRCALLDETAFAEEDRIVRDTPRLLQGMRHEQHGTIVFPTLADEAFFR